MTPGVISFSCPSCGVRLTVPDSMAGISGPCPRCSATIQAPAAAAQAPATPEPAETTVLRVPTQATSPPPGLPDVAPLTTIRPEPRAKHDGKGQQGIATRHSTEDDARKRSRTAASGSGQSETRPRPARFVLPTFFIIAGAAIIYGLCYFFLPNGRNETLRTDPSEESLSETSPASPGSDSAPNDRTSGSEDPVPDQTVSDAPPILADGANAIEAEELLGRFLAAKSLEERLGMFEPPLPAEQLENTILARALPDVFNITPETPAFDLIERLVNFPFQVSFQGGEGSTAEYTILVRKRADLEPKIVVQPFLDLVGGRLAKFAATPIGGTHTFHAIIEAMPRCFEENIPNPDRKFTYKLSASDVGRATARAYASRYSSLAEELFTPDSQIRWGKRIRATVTLQWNTTEDPKQPYIELIEIKSLDWNP